MTQLTPTELEDRIIEVEETLADLAEQLGTLNSALEAFAFKIKDFALASTAESDRLDRALRAHQGTLTYILEWLMHHFPDLEQEIPSKGAKQLEEVAKELGLPTPALEKMGAKNGATS